MTEIIERNKYNSSRIYKICSNLSDKIYIGSTCQAIKQRMSEHIQGYKQYFKTNTRYITSFEIIKLGDGFITLMEECNYNNKQQLLKREGELIKDNINICVNKHINGRTGLEYRHDTKQHIKQHYETNKYIIAEYKKKHYKEHREHIDEYKKQHYETNKEYILNRRKQHYETNKQVIKEKAKQTFTCDCGITLTISTKSRHIKTTKHLQLLDKLFIDELTYYLV